MTPPPTVGAAPPAPAAPAVPIGTFTLAGTDPVRGAFQGTLTFGRGRTPGTVQATYHAKFADGSEGTVRGAATVGADGKVSMYVPLKGAGTGAFAPSAIAPGAPDASFSLHYTFDKTFTSAAGSTEVYGRKLPAGVDSAATSDGVARPGAGLPTLPPGLAPASGAAPGASALGEAARLGGQYASDATFGVSVPLAALDGVELPGAAGMSISSASGNSVGAYVDLKSGGSPTVQLDFRQPLVVKGAWYEPAVEIHSVWLDGDKVETDAHFQSGFLDSIPGVNSLPEKFADKAIAQVTAGFGPLVQLLHSKAAAGQLADPQALAQVLAQVQAQSQTGGGAAGTLGPLGPLAGKLDLAHASATAEVQTGADIVQQQDSVKVTIAGGTRISASAPVNLVSETPGALAVNFDPPIELEDTSHPVLSALANPRVTGITVRPDGTVGIATDASLGGSIVQEQADQQAARASAIVRVLMAEIPPESQLGMALRRAGAH